MKNLKPIVAILCAFTLVCGCVLTGDIGISRAEEAAVNGREPLMQKYEEATPGVAPLSVPEGYVFAGWYTTENVNACTKDTVLKETGVGYAKFVDEDVFGVKSQIAPAAKASDTTQRIRFVTSVDSLNYREVGFIISIQGNARKIASSQVYDSLRVIDSNSQTSDCKPWNEFSSQSKFFKAYTIKNIPNPSFGSVITVNACWTTQDGTFVRGKSVKKSVEMNIFKQKSVDTGVLFNCDTTDELEYTDGKVTVPKANYKEGTGAFKSVGNAAEWLILTLDQGVDITNARGSLDFWLYIDDVANIVDKDGKMYVELSHTKEGHDTNECQWSYDVNQLKSGWNKISLSFVTPGAQATNVVFTDIKYFRIFHNTTTQESMEVIVDDIQAVSTDGETKTSITNCDSADGMSITCGVGRTAGVTSYIEKDGVDYKEGAASLQYEGGANTQILYQMQKASGAEVDISKYEGGSLQFWMYVNNTNYLNGKNVMVELTSSGECDEQELQWTLSLHNGWNHVKLDFEEATEPNNQKKAFDYYNVNYLRIYTEQATTTTSLITKLDGVRAVESGMFLDCDTSSEHNDKKSESKVSVTTDLYKQGTGALKCTDTKVVWYSFLKNEPMDLTAYASGRLQAWLYINDIKYLSEKDVQVELSSAGEFDKDEIQWSIPSNTLKSGWNKLSLPLSVTNPEKIQGNIDYSAVNFLRIYHDGGKEGLMTVVDGIQAVKNEATIVNTLYGTEDVLIADYIPTEMANTYKDKYAIDPNGVKDSTAGIQKVLNDCAESGGGTVYLPTGRYRITNQIIVPAYVTLRGDWQDPDTVGDGKQDYGTIIEIDITEDTIADPDYHGVFELGGSGGVVGVTFYYTNQSVSNLQKYPYTFYVDGISENYMLSAVRNVTVINGYRGIGATTIQGTSDGNAQAHESLQIDNFKGTFLNSGIEIYNSADVGIIHNVNISNKYWNQYNTAYGKEDISNALETYTRTNTSGMILGDVEWSEYTNVTIDGCQYGIHTVTGRRTSNSNATVQFRGSFYDLTITNCTIGFKVDKVDTRGGLTIARSSIDGSEKSIENNTAGLVKLCDVKLTGDTSQSVSDTIVIESMDLSEETIEYSAFYQKPAANMVVAKLPAFQNNTDPTDLTQPPTMTDDERAALVSASSTLQRYLNYMGKCGGGIVYVPGGIYYLDKPITVPANVELRGSSSVANRETMVCRGTLFFTDYGDEDEKYSSAEDSAKADALITLVGENAGLNGVRITYFANGPKTTIDDGNKNLITPYVVRGKAKGVYIVNAMIVAASHGVDFRNCDNHYVEGVMTCCYTTGFYLGGKNGTVNGCLQNGTVLTRTTAPLVRRYWINTTNYPSEYAGNIQQELLWPILKPNMNYIILENAESESIYNTFAYGVKTMLTNIESENTQVINVGTDQIGFNSSQFVMKSGSLLGVNLLHSDSTPEANSTEAKTTVWTEAFNQIYTSKSFEYFEGTLKLYNRLPLNQTGVHVGADAPAVTLNNVTPYITHCDDTSDLSNASSITVTTESDSVKEGTGGFIKEGNSQIRYELKFSEGKDLSKYEDGVLHLWIYINDVDYLDQTTSLSIEISSSGTCDNAELQWNYDRTKLKDGWNELCLDVKQADKSGEIEFNKVNYIRIYQGKNGQNTGLITILDDVRMLKK